MYTCIGWLVIYFLFFFVFCHFITFVSLFYDLFRKVASHNTTAVKRLIAINHIQNKSFCLHNICMCTVFIMYI